MIDRFLVFIILGFVVVFGVTAVLGIKRGHSRIPMAFIEFEEFDRVDSTANFWGVTILNLFLAAGGIGLLIYWFVNGMIE